MKRFLSLLTIVLFSIIVAMAQFEEAPAFPGAEGYGRYTTGGRYVSGIGHTVYHVTNLNDSGEGSLRSAMATSGRRIVVFDVSGTIHLKSELKVNADNLTVLGQTAPGDGICVADYPVTISASNVIIRYMRFRLGDIGSKAQHDINPDFEGYDAFGGGKGKHNIIIDHCSISWSTDECCSFYGNTDFTMQYCIISESLKKSVHAKGSHGYGGIWGGQSASFHHNLIIHHDSRNPRFDHDYVSTLKGPVDYVNNVLYNWGGNSAYGGESGNNSDPKYINMVNNYYKPGPATKWTTRLLNPTTQCGNCNTVDKTKVVPGQFYINGNYMYGSTEVTNDNLCDKAIDPDANVTYAYWKANYAATERDISSDYDFSDYNVISMHSAEAAFVKVLKYAGASYKRDDLDKRLRWEALKGITYFEGSNGSKNGMIDSQSDVGGWPVLEDTGALADTDKDGIPDGWEAEHNLNVGTNNARTFILDEEGYYTDLEVYANSLVQDITQYERDGAIETFEEYYPLGAKVLPPEPDFPSEPDFVLPDIPDTGSDLFNASKATTDKNVDIEGKACTLGGSANPSGSSDTYIKLRTNSDWVFTAKDGYKLTGISIMAYQHPNNNGTTAEIKISSLTVDGGPNLLDADVALPQQSAGTTANLNRADLDAANNITVKFTNNVPSSGSPTPQQQCFATVTVFYEKQSTGIEVVNASTNAKADAPAYYYNLQGQRVAPNTKGIVIYMGKKYFNP